MSITKLAAALIAAATLAGAAVPAYAQFDAAAMPNYRLEGTGGSWVNSANRDFYSPGAAADAYAAVAEEYGAGCTAARVPYRLANGKTVMRLRHICP